MGETEHFTLYGIREGEEMAVQTPDGLVYAEVPLISNYEVEPQIMEQDFDGDGREELAVITYVLHGTGMSIRSLFMADKDAAGTWNIYHLPEEGINITLYDTIHRRRRKADIQRSARRRCGTGRAGTIGQ